jgi:hypothetical protein
VREIERLRDESGDRPASFAELILISRGDQEPLLPERAEQLRAWLLSRWLGESSKEWLTAPNDIAPDERIKFGAVAALTHLVEPRSKDAAIPCCCAPRLLERRGRTTPPFRLGNLSRLPWRHTKGRCTDMHDLPFRACCNEAQLRNATTDQRDARAVWCTFRQRTQKHQAFNRFDKCVGIVNDED